MNKEDEWKLEFNKKGVEISQRVINPIDRQIKYLPVDIREFNEFKEKLENNNINMVVTKIEQNTENENIKSLIFYMSEFRFLESLQISNQKIITDDSEINPKSLNFGNEKKPWRHYGDLLKITAKWLVEKGRIQSKNLPVYVPSGKRYLINLKPIHEYGRPFDGKPYEISKDMYLLTNFSSNDCKIHAEYLMRKFAPEINFKILGFDKS